MATIYTTEPIGKFVLKNKLKRDPKHTELTPNQRNILKELKIKPPKRVLKVDLAA